MVVLGPSPVIHRSLIADLLTVKQEQWLTSKSSDEDEQGLRVSKWRQAKISSLTRGDERTHHTRDEQSVVTLWLPTGWGLRTGKVAGSTAVLLGTSPLLACVVGPPRWVGGLVCT